MPEDGISVRGCPQCEQMEDPLKPIYLFADSRLLFWRERAKPFCHRIKEDLAVDRPFAAYIGASNGDDHTFFEMFRSAMSAVEVTECKMISSCFPPEDSKYLEDADLILLAGGDFERGWRIFEAVGLRGAVVDAYLRGALLIGVSAGAVQLGMGGYVAADSGYFVDTFGLAPFLVGAHEEGDDWHNLRRAVVREKGNALGIGLPAGGGVVCHADRTLEPLRTTLPEFSWVDGDVKCNLLVPHPLGDALTDRFA
jgi:cyanophycinase